MSRGFVKEEDQEEAVLITPRAALPVGVTNYVTPLGFDLLSDERKSLEMERKNSNSLNDSEKRRSQALIDGKMNLLLERINSARIIEPKNQTQDEIRFGAKIIYQNLDSNNKASEYITIVGVDEANIEEHKVAFIAPFAKVFNGKKVGDVVQLKMGAAIKKFEVLEINY